MTACLRPGPSRAAIAFASALLCGPVDQAAPSPESPPLTVESNVHVSVGYKPFLSEVLIAADPRSPLRLLGCAMVYAPEENRVWTAVFLSVDRGRTWRKVLDTSEFEGTFDPTCGFGDNGTAFHASIADAGRSLVVYRSDAGGTTWRSASIVALDGTGLDREWITVDTTNSPYRGALYVHGAIGQPLLDGTRLTGLGLWRSAQNGETFHGPITRVAPKPSYLVNAGNGAIGRNGVLFMPFMLIRQYARFLDPTTNTVWIASPGEAPATLQVITSSDGGRSLSVPRAVAEWHVPAPARVGFSIPATAIDHSDGSHASRVYLAWPDERNGRSRIVVSHSDDDALTWSVPQLVTGGDALTMVDETIPAIAVNNKGVVGVSWYERRSDSDPVTYDLYFAASFDGAGSFPHRTRISTSSSQIGPQTRVSTRAFAAPGIDGSTVVNVLAQSRELFAGDTAGLVADAGGAFHPAWVDNRSGSAQMWTATVHALDVSGARNRHSRPAVDVSRLLATEVMASQFDDANNRVSVTLQLRNSSQRAIEGPLELRILKADTELADRAVIVSEHALTNQVPAVRFDAVDDGGILCPGDRTAARTIDFRLDRRRPFSQDGQLKFLYVRLSTKIFGVLPEDNTRCGRPGD